MKSLAALCACSSRDTGNWDPPATSPTGLVGADEAMRSPDYWIAPTTAPDQLLLARDEIAARNGVTNARDHAIVDLHGSCPVTSR